jgi:alkaline phosphatase
VNIISAKPNNFQKTTKMKQLILSALIVFMVLKGYGQTTIAGNETENFITDATHEVKQYEQVEENDTPRNVILMIGDGMSISHIFAGLTANKGQLFLENFKFAGFSKTQSSNRYITDSAAGGTAISSGVKTKNGAIGVGPDGTPVKTILELAEENGLNTGMISVSSITHATPASFIAHQVDRGMEEEIAADFLKTDIDLFIGGGYKFFTDRQDGRDLTQELSNKSYTVVRSVDELLNVTSGKVAALTANNSNGRVASRGDFLPRSTEKAIELLSASNEGFFLMIEGSAIDWGAHDNDISYVIEEMLDFDRAIGEALDFSSGNGETLVVVTSDHETGGLAIEGGDMSSGSVNADFTSGGHTGTMVPVFAYGPGAEVFGGIYENTEIYSKIRALLNLSDVASFIEDSQEFNYAVYPNPTEQIIYINNHTLEEFDYNVYSVKGDLILGRKEISSTISSVDISDFKPGNYFLEINYNGNSESHQFIVK